LLKPQPALLAHLSPILAKLAFLLIAATVSSACSSDTHLSDKATPEQHGAGRPNIVLLLLDDAGYSDMSAFGGEIQTPNIERIVREGITVRRFYTAARCSPTRAGILTGYHPHDVGMADLAGPQFKTEFSAYQGQLPLGIPLVSELLQAAGYKTYLQGKWHLGDIPGSNSEPLSGDAPNTRGFDYFFGIMRGQANPYPDAWVNPYKRNQASMPLTSGWFSISGLNLETMQQLENQFQTESDTPFFLFFASQAPHYPLAAPKELIAKYRKVYDQPLENIWNERVTQMRHLGLFPETAPTKAHPFADAKKAADIRDKAAVRAAMIEATDTEFGKLLMLLEENDKLDNTLVIVASDNGAAAETAELANAPYRGAKGNLYEGGMLSPLVARWPAGGIEANKVTDEMITYLDLMPTFLTATAVTYPGQWHSGTPLQPLQGRNLLPLFRGENLPPPDYFYWNLYGAFAVLHQGRWKLLANSAYDAEKERNHAQPTIELYDLLSDPAETSNVASKESAMVALLLKNYKAWASQHGAVPHYQVLDAYKKNGVLNLQGQGGG
jgi:arylsulfatase